MSLPVPEIGREDMKASECARERGLRVLGAGDRSLSWRSHSAPHHPSPLPPRDPDAGCHLESLAIGSSGALQMVMWKQGERGRLSVSPRSESGVLRAPGPESSSHKTGPCHPEQGTLENR